MATLQEYEIIEEISSKQTIQVSRARRLSDNKIVVLKKLKISDIYHIARLRQEFNLLKMIHSDNIIEAFELIKYDDHYAIVLEDMTNSSILKNLIKKGGLTIEKTLILGIQLAQVLDDLYQLNIIHKDFNPFNILVSDNKVKLIDFSMAVQLSQEETGVAENNVLEGTLPYISPEQSGRMNRVVDYRSDFYSLGVTLYELLTGELPFKEDDAMGWVHAHIAKVAIPPNELRADIPKSLSNIVMKLLAKGQEDRYQTAYGLKEDLEFCLKHWRRDATIPDFNLGLHDETGKLQFSQKLYGREKETQQLLEIFNRAASGEQALLLVSGYSGIGKTTFVNEIKKHVSEKKGFYTFGKFEKFKRDVPYSAQAFSMLIKQLLSGSPAEIAVWRDRIIDALYPNAQILIDVIPEVEWLIGKQPHVPAIPNAETKTRFELVFSDFIQLFANAAHPLVLCLDDLQWADQPSLELLKSLLSSQVLKNFLVIATYRENEIKPGHVFADFIERLEKLGIRIDRILLKPLNFHNVQDFINDTLKTSQDTTSLSNLVLEKTDANPFFIQTLLSRLYQDKFLSYNIDTHEWDWDIKTIEKVTVTENVADLLIRKIENLLPKTKNILEIASCIGMTFDLHLLSSVANLTPLAVANYLWQALQEKLLLPIGENYKLAMNDEIFASSQESILYQFAHDRIQFTANSLLSTDQKRKLSLKIGNYLLHNTSPMVLEEKVFEIVNYFEHVPHKLFDNNAKPDIAKLYLKAAQKAKSTLAFSSTETYAKHVIDLLEKSGWENYYATMFEAEKLLGQALFFLFRYNEAESQYKKVLELANNNLDKAKILHQLVLLFSTLSTRFPDAIASGYEGLKLLGIKLPKNPTAYQILIKFLKLCWLLRKDRIKRLIYLPAVKETDEQLVMDIIFEMVGPCLVSNPNLMAVITLTCIEYSLKHGTYGTTATCLSFFGTMYIAILKNYERAYEIGDVSFRLMEKYPHKNIMQLEYFLVGEILYGSRQAYNTSIEYMEKVYQIGHGTGEQSYTAYSMVEELKFMYLAGQPLDKINEQLEHFSPAIPQEVLDVTPDVACSLKVMTVITEFLLARKTYAEFKSWIIDIIEYREFVNNFPIIRASNSILILSVLYLIEDYKLAYRLHKNIKVSELALVCYAPEYYFYSALTLYALYPQSSLLEKFTYRLQCKKFIKKLKKHAKLNPANYESKYLLLLAGYKLIKAQLNAGILYYDRAIASSRKYQQIHIEAIAYEMMAKWFYSYLQPTSAEGYLKKAFITYQQLGAIVKVNNMIEKFPQLGLHERSSEENGNTISTATSSDTIKLLDLSSIMKASQAISSHIVLKDLLVDLIKVMIESSGAEKGALLLVRNEKMLVEAMSTSRNMSPDELPKLLEHTLLENCNSICKSIVRYVERTEETLVLENASQHMDYKDDRYIIENKVLSVFCLPILHQGKLVGILYLENNLVSGAFTNKHIQVAHLLASQSAISLEIAQLYAAYNQFVPHQFLDLLGKRSIIDVTLGDHAQKNMTILFSDIRGFTQLSEQLTPDETFQFMNEYLKIMEPIVIEHNGFIDKYIGDAIMALFPNNVEDALDAAVSMHKQLWASNKERAISNKPAIQMGIGVNYGNVMLGTIGGTHRIETSVVGDNVNLASRLENLTKEYNSSLLISDVVYQKIKDKSRFNIRFVGLTKVAGKQNEIKVWEIYDGDTEEIFLAKKTISPSYAAAIEDYLQGSYQTALNTFKNCLPALPNDKLLLKYIDNCEKKISGKILKNAL